ncbi:hypothetical protein ABEB36_003508 [Hypothenemus hampei]|uniref:Uncharacterized protein n=1 Tax=Hypothenemus hampei TaxID=57062 RepID=A0ABD1F9F0_HYPHA
MFKILGVVLSLCILAESLPTDKSNEVLFVPYDVKYVPVNVSPEVGNEVSEKSTLKKDKTVSFDLFQEKFDLDQTRMPEDYVLIPISVLRELEKDSLQKDHTISKRQAPDDDLLVYRPLVQFSTISRNRRRVVRPPPLVGYLNNYDKFPTVA